MQAEEEEEPEVYVAKCHFLGSGSDQLSFGTGEEVLVHVKADSDWWWAELRGETGYVPAKYLRQEGEEPEEDAVPEDPWQDEEYFDSYGTLRLHLEMLSDKSRTEAYRRVIDTNSASLQSKVVLDLGCGTGIISMFCAKLAKPSAVYAVEASSMADYTRQLVRQNQCDQVVTVLQGRAEDIELPEQVDVLVSEWMGNCLLFEFMVESVLLVRDRCLKAGGTMWPSTAALTLAPCQAESYFQEKMSFWENPYGLDFTPLQSLAHQEFFTRPKFSHVVQPEDCLAAAIDVITLDMKTLQVTDLEEMEGQFHFSVEKPGECHGFAAWFNVCFEGLQKDAATVVLDTGPRSELTHWKQTLFMLDRPIHLDAGDSVSGSICLRRNAVWRRHMTVDLQWNVVGSSKNNQVGKKSFPMWR